MPPLSRGRVEALVLAITTLALAVGVTCSNGALSPLPGWAWAPAGVLNWRFQPRQAGSSGLSLGTLALPWAFVGAVILQQRHGGWEGSAVATRGAVFAALASLAAAAGTFTADFTTAAFLPATPADTQAGGGGGEAPVAPTRCIRVGHVLTAIAFVGVPVTAVGIEDSFAYCFTFCLLAGLPTSIIRHLLDPLPGVFAVGESLLATQAATLLLHAALRQPVLGLSERLPAPLWPPSAARDGPYTRFVVLLSAYSLGAAAALVWLALRLQRVAKPDLALLQSPASGRKQRKKQAPTQRTARWVMPLFAAAALAAAVPAAPAAAWALQLALSTWQRCTICCWWGANLAVAMPAQYWINRSGRVPAILVRKGYHLLAVSLFLPALLLEPQLLGMALAAAWALLLVLEVLRISGLPGIAPRLHAFMTSFTDGRDAGLVLVTHFTLLLGMAAPIWLSQALDERTTGAADVGGLPSSRAPVLLPAYAGIMIIGLGDTAASAVGVLLGRHPICRGSRKTWEGTLAAVAATLAGWWVLAAWPATGVHIAGRQWAGLAAATALSCLLEAVTTQLDNIFVPLHYFALLCLV